MEVVNTESKLRTQNGFLVHCDQTLRRRVEDELGTFEIESKYKKILKLFYLDLPEVGTIVALVSFDEYGAYFIKDCYLLVLFDSTTE